MAERLPPDYGQSLRSNAEQNDTTEISARQRKLWSLFQHTATSLTHLYKCKSQKQLDQAEDQESWIAFQSAASSLTSLYRESADILASVEKPRPSPHQTSTAVSDLSSPPQSLALSTMSSRSSPSTKDFAKPMPNNCESVFSADALFGNEPPTAESLPSNQNFDFLSHHHGHHGSCRLKRSWSPSRWPDDDMDQLGAKKKRFF